ncbi:MAG: L-iditol 2-dehydrogenase [Hyphomicrobiaceae bacterium]|jgi:L-iditol 2-dehydrogenase
MKVATLYKADDIRVENVPIPEIGPGEALVRTRVCGICTGDIMGWYMEKKAPLVFGHEPAGEIVAVGEGVEGFGKGDRVFVHHHAPCGECRRCRRGLYVHCPTWRATNLVPGGMSEYFKVGRDNLASDTLRLPESLGFVEGSLIEPAACVVKSLRRGAVTAEDVVLVVGLGIMGQLHVALAKLAGARVIAADLVPFRLEKARSLGADELIDVRRTSLADGVKAVNNSELADLVIVGPGSLEAMRSGIEAAGPGGRVVLFTTSHPSDRLEISPFDLYFNEISIIPSYSCGPDDTRAALGHLERGEIRAADLVTHRFGIDRVTDALAMAGRVDEALKTVVEFD